MLDILDIYMRKLMIEIVLVDILHRIPTQTEIVGYIFYRHSMKQFYHEPCQTMCIALLAGNEMKILIDISTTCDIVFCLVVLYQQFSVFKKSYCVLQIFIFLNGTLLIFNNS